MGNASAAPAGGISAEHGRAAVGPAIVGMENAGPGWYYDPDDQAIYRYWDGKAWTDHRSDTVLADVPG